MSEYQAVYDAVRSRITGCDTHDAISRAASQAFQSHGMDYYLDLMVADFRDSHCAPHAVMRPKLFIDGNMWCALYGSDLMEGISGFGISPADACVDFDANWRKRFEPVGARGVWLEQVRANDEGGGA